MSGPKACRAANSTWTLPTCVCRICLCLSVSTMYHGDLHDTIRGVQALGPMTT